MKVTSVRNLVGLLILGISVTLPAAPVAAAISAFTSFENEIALGGNYVDTGNPDVDHDLVNNTGQPIVDSTTTGSGAAGDLGFNARVVTVLPARAGLTDGDEVGVTNDTSVTGTYPDGSQGYRLSDTDNLMVVEFDPVPITLPTQFEIDYFIAPTGYEIGGQVSDVARIFLTIDGSTTVDILDTTNVDIDDLDIEGRWIRGTADLTGLGTSAVLTVAVDFNGADEALYVDRVSFSAVPEPTSILLALIAAAALICPRSGHKV